MSDKETPEDNKNEGWTAPKKELICTFHITGKGKGCVNPKCQRLHPPIHPEDIFCICGKLGACPYSVKCRNIENCENCHNSVCQHLVRIRIKQGTFDNRVIIPQMMKRLFNTCSRLDKNMVEYPHLTQLFKDLHFNYDRHFENDNSHELLYKIMLWIQKLEHLEKPPRQQIKDLTWGEPSKTEPPKAWSTPPPSKDEYVVSSDGKKYKLVLC